MAKPNQSEQAFIFVLIGVILLAYANLRLDAKYDREDMEIIKYRESLPKRERVDSFKYTPMGPDPSRQTTKDNDILLMDEDEFKDYMREYLGDEYDLTPIQYEREQR